MDTIFESLRRVLKKVTGNTNQEMTINSNPEMTVNSDQDLEKLQELNQELRRLREIESQRPLEPSEEDRRGMLLAEEISRRYNTKEMRDEAAKLEQDSEKYRKKIVETPNKFKEGQWVRFKTSTVPRIPAGLEGVILYVLSPDFDLYIEQDVFMHKYLLEVHGKDPETSQILGSAVPIVDEDKLEATARRNWI